MKQHDRYHEMMEEEKAGARIITYALVVAIAMISFIFIWCCLP
jgi:hypothetical protein